MSEYLRMDKERLEKDLKLFREKAIKLGAEDAVPIKTKQIVIRNWILLKCKYGCSMYGKRLTCPPYSPTPDEMRKIVNEYEIALLVKFGPCVECGFEREVNIHKAIYELERYIFLSGYYAAFGLACGPCNLCPECNVKEGYCLKPYMARPSMEACGIDVFATVRKAGFKLKVLKSYDERPVCFGLVLVT